MKLPTLSGAAWLAADETQAVLSALGSDPAVVRIVGGAVRNALIDEPVTEIDLATALTPQDVGLRAEAAGLKVVPTGVDHGTVTVIVDGRPFEVTTLRTDVATDGRRAKVAFTGDWAIDASRRDFTMNALYCDAHGTLYDPVGGFQDLVDRNVRFIGDPDTRIEEDYLRILRFFRFFAWYGTGRPDAASLKACARKRQGLATLSAERVWSEIKRLLAAPDPGRALLWMRTTEILQKVLPESWGIDAIPRLVAAEQSEGWQADPMLRLISIIPPHRARIDKLAGRLRLANAEQKRLLAWADAPDADPAHDEAAVAENLYRTGVGPVLDHLRLLLARVEDAGESNQASRLRDQIAFAQSWSRPDFPVRGRDLLARGYLPGPDVSKTLDFLETRWIESGFRLSHRDLLASLDGPAGSARESD